MSDGGDPGDRVTVEFELYGKLNRAVWFRSDATPEKLAKAKARIVGDGEPEPVPVLDAPEVGAFGGGEEAIVAGLLSAEAPPARDQDKPSAPAHKAKRGAPIADEPMPIKPLGMNGLMRYFLTPSGQVVGLKASEISKMNILGMIEDRPDWLYSAWPRLSQSKDDDEKPRVIGWRHDAAAEWIARASAEAGLFDPGEDVRGVGVWPPTDRDVDEGRTGLIVHYGTGLSQGDEALVPQKLGGMVYPARKELGRPASEISTDADAAEALEILRAWHWKDKRGPRLLLGWIGCAMIPACLDWRPSIWVTAANGSGKSELLKIVDEALSKCAIHTMDASYSGLRNKLNHSAQACLVDEAEPEENSRKAEQIADLIRITATRGGGSQLRADASGGVIEYVLDTCFLVSSIARPPLASASLDRLSLLALLSLEGYENARPSSELGDYRRRMRILGSRFRRRIVDRYSGLRQRITMIKAALVEDGHRGRSADQLAALLGCADLLCHSRALTVDLANELAAEFPYDASANQSEHDQCAGHLLTSKHPTWRSGSHDVLASLIIGAALRTNAEADPQLRQTGLAVVDGKGRKQQSPDPSTAYLAIANAHQALNEIFGGTPWAGRSGRAGAWKESFERFDGAILRPPMSFGGVKSRAVLVPLRSLPLEIEFEDPKKEVEF